MVRSTKLFPRTPSIASATIVGGISILFERQFSSPARKKGIPLAALWRFSLSLSLVYTRGNLFKLSLFPRLFPYTLYYILFLLSFPFLCRSRRIALVILVIKLVANLASLDPFVEM